MTRFSRLGLRALLPAAILAAFAVPALAIWLPGGSDYGAAPAAPATTLEARLTARTDRLAALTTATAARPVFHGSRRPIETAQPAAAPEPVLSLMGVISDAGEKIAFVRISTGAALYSVGKGDAVGQWRILDIGTEEIQVSKGGADPVTLRID